MGQHFRVRRWYDNEDARQDAFLEAFGQTGIENLESVITYRSKWRLIDAQRRHEREVDPVRRYDLWARRDRMQEMDPALHSARNETSSIISQVVTSLPLTQQRVVRLHYWADLSPQEIAKQLSITPQAVRQCLRRACQGLQANTLVRSLQG
ncbi:sigma-70 family RNA polymerase sigma factor [Thalassoglobus polymorphus]|uniref:RNA polymerase sigma factor n=1 Tax=Thalassoglobus polymorphus TaxID=2527994 RepID=A0A517QQQ2_9PLAN|nr:sigma-70 family RNA polymerase sigma factor [Thalassoglobus polymorphus]QDT33919.1 RNA polymerase sigma factor [Thalassoglobus polymorphus]